MMQILSYITSIENHSFTSF